MTAAAGRRPELVPPDDAAPAGATYRARRLGIDTGDEPVVYLRADSQVVRSEGFDSETRVWVRAGGRGVLATLNVVTGMLIGRDEAGLSETAWARLAPAPDAPLAFAHPVPVESLHYVRAKIYGNRFAAGALDAIVADVAAGLYSPIQLASFLTACGGDRLDLEETTALTGAMVAAGDRLRWDAPRVMDKHCVGGLPGNRTSLVLVPIVAAAGLVIPKTSSHAITSPSGTADAMATLAPVDLDGAQIRRVVEREGACIVWGGSARLSPADDVLIRVERPLDLDSPGQLVASVLSKKVAAGATHVLVDVPVGPTAKIRTFPEARRLSERLDAVGRAVGLTVVPLLTDGVQPVGRGIGPALEARDALAVLRNEPGAPADLRERALLLAGQIFELAAVAPRGSGQALARSLLDDSRAWRKFQAICAAQGGMREPPRAAFTRAVPAPRDGRVLEIDNRRLARVAKLAGAPLAPAAGLELHVRLGDVVVAGQAMFTVHADAAGELAYALAYAASAGEIVRLGPP